MMAELDCRACGACCREASEGRILVSTEDIVRWRRAGKVELVRALVPGHFGELGMPDRNGACSYLGVAGHPNDCSMYEDRPDTCRDFEAGSPQCLEFRRRAGL